MDQYVKVRWLVRRLNAVLIATCASWRMAEIEARHINIASSVWWRSAWYYIRLWSSNYTERPYISPTHSAACREPYFNDTSIICLHVAEHVGQYGVTLSQNSVSYLLTHDLWIKISLGDPRRSQTSKWTPNYCRLPTLTNQLPRRPIAWLQ